MVVREENHPLGTHCMSDKTKHRVWASFPVWLGKAWYIDIREVFGTPRKAIHMFIHLMKREERYDIVV